MLTVIDLLKHLIKYLMKYHINSHVISFQHCWKRVKSRGRR